MTCGEEFGVTAQGVARHFVCRQGTDWQVWQDITYVIKVLIA